MSKKIVAMLMAVAMAFSLLPVTALATDGTPDTTTKDVVDGHYTDEEKWESGKPENAIPDSLKDTVTVDKTAKKVDGQDNQYEVTLTVQMKHKETAVPPGAAATVLVIDTSSSMNNNNRLSAAKTAAINFLKSYSGFSESDFDKGGKLRKNVSDKNLKRYVSLVTFNSSASAEEWGNWKNKESWIDVSTKDGYNKLLNAINDIKAGGGTNLDDALRLAKEQMQSSSITQIDQSKKNVIALTDGVPTFYVGKGLFGNEKSVSQHGNYGCPDTNAATTASATALKAKVNAVYTVCFGAASDKCWTEGSTHTWKNLGTTPDKKHTIDGPTVGDFLKDNIATTPTSEKQYAYNADDADKLYEAFAAITQTITDGLNEGVVTDGLPAGVAAVEGSGFETTWTLDSSSVTPTTSNGYNVYTYTKTYKVNVDPAAVSTVKVGEVNYAPLNTPTILTVQNGGQDVTIPFPIPAIRINKTQATVTFKVENGTWSDGTTDNKTTIVTMFDGKGTLSGSDVPTGMKANANYEGGAWDTIPNTETNGITGDVTYTYKFTPKSTWDTKQLKSAKNLDTSDWTTTVTLTLPMVNENKEVTPAPIAVKSGSYVIDQIGNEFTFMDGLSLEVNDKKLLVTKDKTTENCYHFGTQDGQGAYPYTVTYTPATAQFKWEINQDIPAGTKVTLSYKLKLTNPNKTAGTYGVTDLDGNGFVDGAETTKVVADDALYTNEKAALYIKEKENNQEKEIAVFPKPSVSYTVSSGSSGSHSGGSRPSLNTKDHYGYIIGYPVDYYTGQPTTDQTKKPVRPEGKITRAEVATIYFRMLTDESRTKFWSQSNSYSDVKAGDWFNNAVSTLSNAGIIAGYEDGSFRPNGYITRAEFATIAARFFDVTYSGKDLFPDISGHWAKDYINQAANKGFVNGYEDGTFKPDRNITRAEAVTLVNRTLDRHPDKNHFTKDMLVWPDNMDQTKWYYADMQEATNSHTYQMKENSDKTKYENWTKTLPIRNWEALEKAWSNANSSQGNGNVV